MPRQAEEEKPTRPFELHLHFTPSVLLPCSALTQGIFDSEVFKAKVYTPG